MGDSIFSKKRGERLGKSNKDEAEEQWAKPSIPDDSRSPPYAPRSEKVVSTYTTLRKKSEVPESL